MDLANRLPSLLPPNIQIMWWFIWEVTLILYNKYFNLPDTTNCVECVQTELLQPPKWIITWSELDGNKDLNMPAYSIYFGTKITLRLPPVWKRAYYFALTLTRSRGPLPKCFTLWFLCSLFDRLLNWLECLTAPRGNVIWRRRTHCPYTRSVFCVQSALLYSTLGKELDLLCLC